MYFNHELHNFNSNCCTVLEYECFLLNDQVCKSNTLNKQWRTMVCPPAWVVGEVLTNPYLTNWPYYETDTCESGQE